MLSQIINAIVTFVGDMGYAGIFFMMFLESSFFPFPSEVVMVPAGYLVYKGEMNVFLAVFFGVLGSLAGAIFNYYLALYFGRAFIIKFGRYFFFGEKNMEKMEAYFIKHGEISTFLGRLIIGIRQYISLPAGLARMNLFRFCIYTSLGALIWVIILVIFGYYAGEFIGNGSLDSLMSMLSDKHSIIQQNLHLIAYVTLGVVVLIGAIYVAIYKFKGKK